jgi:hypothetical protein
MPSVCHVPDTSALSHWSPRIAGNLMVIYADHLSPTWTCLQHTFQFVTSCLNHWFTSSDGYLGIIFFFLFVSCLNLSHTLPVQAEIKWLLLETYKRILAVLQILWKYWTVTFYSYFCVFIAALIWVPGHWNPGIKIWTYF